MDREGLVPRRAFRTGGAEDGEVDSVLEEKIRVDFSE